MKDKLIENYIKNMTINDLDALAKNNNIFLNNQEKIILYDYLQKYWYQFYKGNPTNIINDLKNKITQENFEKGLNIYNQYKNKT